MARVEGESAYTDFRQAAHALRSEQTGRHGWSAVSAARRPRSRCTAADLSGGVAVDTTSLGAGREGGKCSAAVIGVGRVGNRGPPNVVVYASSPARTRA